MAVTYTLSPMLPKPGAASKWTEAPQSPRTFNGCLGAQPPRVPEPGG